MSRVQGALRRAWSLSADPSFCRQSAALSVIALAVGIVSGGTVRLTGSGLGCSDWPACTSTSVVAPLQFHAWVEFGNRLVNVVITVGIVLVVVAVWRRRPRRRDLIALSGGLIAGIAAEVVLGGETVLHKLAPQFVMAHFLLAVVLLVNAAILYHMARQPDTTEGLPPGWAQAVPARRLVRPGHVMASRCMLVLTGVVVALGTVVTSTGPHAGAPGVPRFGFSLHAVAQLHGTSVELLLALTVATLWSMYRARVAPAVLRRGEVLLAVLISQAAVGYAQYLTGDPVLLVGIHITGATAVVLAMVAFNVGLYEREPPPVVQTVVNERKPAPDLAKI
ncbi:MAG TPA: COX15/CtaA family protein [Acidimicrobiales bacterium]|nr:COX15/CtaA family protein [Acidimicrobiales bacterium]